MSRRITIFVVFFFLPILLTAETRTVHVVGDSHSLEFGCIPGYFVHWMGPITMHRIGRDGKNFLYLPTLGGVKEGDAVIFSFGEIDVRYHVGRQRDLHSRSMEEILNTLATKYIYTILQNRLLYQDLTCIVYSVTPPVELLKGVYPAYGALSDRILNTKALNKKLSDLCHLVGILFLDVYEDYATPEGSLNTEYSDHGVHINAHHYQPILQKLNPLLLKDSLLIFQKARPERKVFMRTMKENQVNRAI